MQSPVKLADLSEEEKQNLKNARKGFVVSLNRTASGGGVLGGKVVRTCPECGQFFIGADGSTSTVFQNHLAFAHDISAGLLGNGGKTTINKGGKDISSDLKAAGDIFDDNKRDELLKTLLSPAQFKEFDNLSEQAAKGTYYGARKRGHDHAYAMNSANASGEKVKKEAYDAMASGNLGAMKRVRAKLSEARTNKNSDDEMSRIIAMLDKAITNANGGWESIPEPPEPTPAIGKVKISDLKPGDFVEGGGLRGRVTSIENGEVITDAGTIRADKNGNVSRLMEATPGNPKATGASSGGAYSVSKVQGEVIAELPAAQQDRYHAAREAGKNHVDALREATGAAKPLKTRAQIAKDREAARKRVNGKALEGIILELKDAAARNAARDKISADGAGRGVGSGGKMPSQVAKDRNAKQGGVKKRYIRSEAGAKRYGGSIGDVIGKAKIKKGETLSELAEKYYGDASKWKLIAKASGIKDPKKIPVGTELTFPEDPDAPKKKGKGTGTRKGKQGGVNEGPSRAERAREDHKTYDDKDSVALEGTYYVEKGESIETILKRFYGNSDRLEDVLKVNGLKKGDKILEGQSLILPDVDPDKIYPDEKKKQAAKKKQGERAKKKAPNKAPSGSPQKAASNGYVVYSDGSVYGPYGWIIRKPKK